MNKVLSFAAVFFFSQCYFSQEKPIDEVVVQGKLLSLPMKKVSENVEIITKEDIKNAPANTVEDLLSFYTGIDIRKRGAGDMQGDISIRGGSFEQVLLLLNGIRMNDPQTGHNMMNIPVSLENIEKIEIVKGPSSRKFGQNAYSGVVNIITKPAATDQYTASGTIGDFKTWFLGASANFGNQEFRNLLSVNYAESAGYRHNTDYTTPSVWYQNQLKTKNGVLKMQAGFVQKKFGANGFYASPTATEQYEETQTSVASLTSIENLNENLQLTSNLYWRRAQDMYLFIRDNPGYYRNMHIGNNYGGEMNLKYQSQFGVSGLGVEAHQEDLRSSNLGARGRFVTQISAEHHFSLLQNKLTVNPGLSWINYTGTGKFFYPGLDVGYSIDDQNKIYANVAKVHRVPTYTDLYYRSMVEEGNPDLKPENALSYELGYQLDLASFLFKTSVFAKDSKNGIDWVRNAADTKWVAENISNLKTKGVEVEMSKKLETWVKEVSVGYTYLDSQSSNNENGQNSRYALENLKHQMNAKLRLGYWKLGADVVYQYNERLVLGSYQLLDAKLYYTSKAFDAFLLVNNITNTQYTGASLVPMPKRWFQVGVTYRLK